jgi:hypothetical protein
MQFLIDNPSTETKNFIAPFFNGAIVDYPGVNSEEIVIARDDSGIIQGVLQYRVSLYNMVAAIIFVCVSPGAKLSVFGGLIDKFLTRIEELGITTIYATIPKKHYDSYSIADKKRQENIRKRRYPMMLRWQSYLQEIIPTQQVSSAHVVKMHTLSGRTYLKPTIIIKYELKDEFKKI